MKMRNDGLLLVSVALVMFSITQSALAGGLFLNEFGTPSMGTAGAGAQGWADDASTSFHNPAGLTRLEGAEFMTTGGVAYSRVIFDVEATPI